MNNQIVNFKQDCKFRSPTLRVREKLSKRNEIFKWMTRHRLWNRNFRYANIVLVFVCSGMPHTQHSVSLSPFIVPSILLSFSQNSCVQSCLYLISAWSVAGGCAPFISHIFVFFFSLFTRSDFSTHKIPYLTCIFVLIDN